MIVDELLELRPHRELTLTRTPENDCRVRYVYIFLRGSVDYTWIFPIAFQVEYATSFMYSPAGDPNVLRLSAIERLLLIR